MDLFFPMVALGLVTSVHCVSMCGPLVLTYAVKDGGEGSLRQRMVPHVAYQGAKIVSYILVGLLLGAIGSIFDLAGIRGWVTLLAGAFMLVFALQMTGRFPALMRLTPRPPKALVRAISALRRRAASEGDTDDGRLALPVAFGLLTGLMPCGPLQSAQLTAAASGSAVSGALAMFGFGLGTAPLMLAFGTVSSMLTARMKRRMMAVAAVIVAVLGVTMVDRGLTLVGSPVTARSLVRAIAPGDATASTSDATSEARLVIEDVRFEPDVVRVAAGAPARLIVERREDNPCSAQLAIPQLGVLVDLVPYGTTVVELPTAPPGSYTLTCGMGMMSGTLVVEEAGGGTSAQAAIQAARAPEGDGTQPFSCACCGGAGAAAGSATEGTATVEGDVQRIAVDVSQGYYDPSTINLVAGMPAEITFSQSAGCTAVVHSYDLDFEADLTRGPVTVTLPPLEPGEYTFSCGMDMVFGRVVVR